MADDGSVSFDLAHHIPGRVRFHVPRLARDAAYGARLHDAAGRVPGVRQVRVSRSSASLVVSYGGRWERVGGTGLPAHGSSVVAALIACIQGCADATWSMPAAAGSDGIRSIPADTDRAAALPPLERPVDVVRHLGMPAVALGLAAATAVGTAIPGSLVGAAVLAAAIPHARRAAQGLREERRPTVEILDVTTCVLLVARSSFLPAAFTMAVIELAEVARQMTARRGRPPLSAPTAALQDVGAAPDGDPPITVVPAPRSRESRVGDHARRTGDWAVTPTLAVGALVGAASSNLGRTTGIVSLDMGTGMRVSAPVAVLVAQDHALRSDILFRGGRAVETLGQMDAVVLGDDQADAHPALVEALSRAGLAVARMPRGLTPGRRVACIEELQASRGRIVLLVDDHRDVLAATQADLAVTIGSADDLSREVADIVLLGDSLDDLLRAIEISRHVTSVLKQNQRLVVGANVAGIAYGALAPLSPIGGVLLNNGVSLLAVLNGLRRPGGDRRSPAPMTTSGGQAAGRRTGSEIIPFRPAARSA